MSHEATRADVSEGPLWVIPRDNAVADKVLVGNDGGESTDLNGNEEAGSLGVSLVIRTGQEEGLWDDQFRATCGKD